MRELGIHLTGHLIRDYALLLCCPGYRFFSCNYLMQPCKTTFSYSAVKYSFLDTFHKMKTHDVYVVIGQLLFIMKQASKRLIISVK